MPGGAIHYVDLGPRDAPVVVMIHGLSGQLQHFTFAVTDQLSDEYRLIVVDRPGCGYSTRLGPAQADLLEQGRMIHSALEQIGVDKAMIVGHSLGGAVALGMALNQPERVTGLALIAPLTHRPKAPSQAFSGLVVQNDLHRRILSRTVAVPMAQMAGATVLAEVFRPDPVAEGFISRAGGVLGLRPKAFVTASQDYEASGGVHRLSKRYADLTVPGAVLFGEQDVILNAEEQGKPMVQYGLTYHELKGRGHMLPMVTPGDCANLVREVAAMTKTSA